ncbi:MAG TPA: type IV secretory system conjugative DNA transfer family protein [Chitinophagales bacterium]|nr:type IV secretory system conjugative DNA transfer family protein [Chitinophagales bacterium]HRG26890.1 type IV secretory system conjugative DNA transfer family protein [Chitinophagales bacterium]HRG85220.1 type IV secretory system conjugative DNA transfer family protein [Chitinophagales bacterium]HRH51816.1 type IV secretory system conjugative DNA transfer family protein [Chitinophagales bacterium]
MIKLFAAIFELLFSVVAEIVTTIFDFIVSIIQPKRKTEYTADFIAPGSILRKHDTGFCLTGKFSMSSEDSHKNCLVLGGSGSGKSSIILINSMLFMMHGKNSLIINDPSGELRLLTSGALIKYGYIVKVLDYNNILSECFNPLKRCKSISDIQKLSALLVRNALGESKGDQFFNKIAESLLSLFIRYLVFYVKPEYSTLYNVLHLINLFAGGGAEKIDRLIVKTKDEKLLAEYKAFIAYGDKTLMSIVATVKSALSLWSDETIAKITSIDTIDFAEFRVKRIALFINNSVPTMNYYGALSSLFFQQFFNEILVRIPDKKENSVFFLLDEAGSMYLPSISVTISNIRKNRGGILCIYQDYSILENIYGAYEAKNISANCYAKVYLPGQPIETCRMLETTLGKFEYEDEKSGNTKLRSLMTADEIRMTDKAIILIGNKAPIHATLHPFYKNSKLKSLTELPSYEPNNILPFDTPPLIAID